MAKIIVNNEIKANGKVSVSRTINDEKDGFIIGGVFSSHLYYENITSLETERFIIEGIEVYQENFGSDDYDILYNFVAKKFRLKDVMQNGIGFILLGEEMDMIEKEMYKNDHPILGGIGPEYKNMYINSEGEDEDVSE